LESDSNITLRKCDYYKDTGKIYNDYMIFSHMEIVKIIPSILDIVKRGISKIDITNIQLKLLENK
jgi:hypothetical protein